MFLSMLSRAFRAAPWLAPFWAFTAGPVHAQAVTPQAPSPWSLGKALDAPTPLTVSGSFRLRLDSIDGQPKPGFNASDQVINQRTTLFAEYHPGPVRLGGEIYDSRAYGADARTPISPNEVNTFELVQAYVAADVDRPWGKATVQAGRMGLNLGSRRLVAADDYRNTTNSYTGVRAQVAMKGGVQATAIYVLPVLRLPEDIPSILDNAYESDREGADTRLWGGVLSKPLSGRITGELTYLRLDERDTSERRTRDRRLDTYGGRLFRPAGPAVVDFEVEAFAQSGTIRATLDPAAAEQEVAAGFVHADLGYTFDRPMRPRLSLRYDWASGDKPGAKFERFDTLYGMRRAEIAPSGLYNTVGRANLSSPAIRLEWAPSKRTDAFVHYRPLWLASRTDSFSTSAVRDPAGRSGAFAGHQVELRVRHWLVPDALRFEVDAAYLAKGRFLKTAPNAPATGDTTYVSWNLTALF